MHAAQTRICFLAPFTTARTRRKLGFQRRRRVLFAWLITFPKCGPLPHNSHFIAIIFLFNPSKMFKTQVIILADPAAFSHSPFVLAQFGVEGKDNAEYAEIRRAKEATSFAQAFLPRKSLSVAPCVDTLAAVLNTLLR
jgi:hypothetical protein